MRILIGIIVFVGWGLISVQWYVCGVKGLCNDNETVQNDVVILNQNATDSINEASEVDSVPVDFTIKQISIYFPFAKSKTKINETLQDSLKMIIGELKATDALLLLQGNTDSIGSDENNYELGEERAKWIQELLTSYGLTAEKIKVESKGERKPIEENSTEKGRRKNRRVDIIVSDLK